MLSPSRTTGNPTDSISFRWLPTLYPVRWADDPLEVPEHDPSRGCPLWKSHEARRSWAVKPPLTEGYPRLVRASLEPVTGADRHSYPLLNDLSSLYQYVDRWRAGKPVQILKRKVKECSETYGAASSKGNTLTAWLELAATVRLHRRLQRALKKGGLKELDGEWSIAYTQLVERQTVDEKEYKRRLRLAEESRLPGGPWTVAVLPIDSNLDPVERAELGVLEVIRAWVRASGKKRAETIRLAIADGLYDAFGQNLHYGGDDAKVLLQHWGVRATCHVDVWLLHALAEEWRYGVPLKVCPVCRELFTPTQGNNIYCIPKGPCPVEAHKQKARAAQS